MNEGFYPNLDINFEQAYDLCEKNFSHDELLELLAIGNIPQKQIAALKFDKVKNEKDALALLNNLTGCDGKIREAVALKINQMLIENQASAEIFAKLSAEVFADATIDINGNICRLVIDSAKILKHFPCFSDVYILKILKFTNEALQELDNFIFRDKKYVINKQLFKLYWCLEALKYFYDRIPVNTMLEILNKCSQQKEYTIREKTAQIAVLSANFNKICEKLKNDENYYVRKALYKINNELK